MSNALAVIASYSEGKAVFQRAVKATSPDHVDHVIVSMLLAVGRRLASLYIERRDLCASGIRTTTDVANVDHAVLGILLAVRCRLAAFPIKRRPHRAGDM